MGTVWICLWVTHLALVINRIYLKDITIFSIFSSLLVNLHLHIFGILRMAKSNLLGVLYFVFEVTVHALYVILILTTWRLMFKFCSKLLAWEFPCLYFKSGSYLFLHIYLVLYFSNPSKAFPVCMSKELHVLLYLHT